MRTRIRTITWAAGAGMATALVLLVVATLTRAIVPAVIGGIIGLAEILVLCLFLPRAFGKTIASVDQLSTRSRNLETRFSALTKPTDGDDSRHHALESLLSDLRDDFHALEVRVADDEARALRLDSREKLHNQRKRREARSSDAVITNIDVLRDDVSRLRSAQVSAEQHVHRTLKDVQVLQTRIPEDFLEAVNLELARLRSKAQESLTIAFESAVQLGRAPDTIVSQSVARILFQDYLARGDYLRLAPLITHFDLLPKQGLATLRTIYKFLRAAGYWEIAARVVKQVHAKTGRYSDLFAYSRVKHEVELFSEPKRVQPELPNGDAYNPNGPVLHMVGRVLPETQTGYTLRTHYTARAQVRKGLPVAIVGQAGITDHELENMEFYQHDGIDYYLLPGRPRTKLFIDEWLARNIVELATLVRELKPSILHAHSDFFNELIVDAVGKKYSIPTVYETRGFWEESWLSRTIAANQWGDDAEGLFALYGRPSAYELRKHAEEVARLQPDHVFTLAEVMRDHILNSAHGRLQKSDVSIVSNAVDAASFPIQDADRTLAAEIGLPTDAIVVGYISSIVEYEGIDTLIDAFDIAGALTDVPLCLLIVGDGDYLETLNRYVDDNEICNVHFTGRVPHADVLRYYGLIDVFVVPRKVSTVSHLVTPLKPFEAFSTGRAVILSDVTALKEIADQSNAVDTFRAGDAEDLSRKIVALAEDPERRRTLGSRAARWVRNHRSWDSNVNAYYRVYKNLGFTGDTNLLAESELALDDRGINPGELLEELRSAELPAPQGWFTIQELEQSGESILTDGWKFPGFEPVPVTTIQNWASFGEHHRSWGFHLHAWEFMDPLLQSFDDTGDERWLRESIGIALQWISVHREASHEADPMAWYDMSQALRMPRLLSLLLRTVRIDALRNEAVILAEALAQHLSELQLDRAYNRNNNHGFYTAVSQVHAAKYASMFPSIEATRVVGNTRLAEMAADQFAPDGVHLEHSPDYHRMLLASFELAVKDGLIEDEEVRNRVRRAAHVLGWMIQPDGALVQFGDSPATKVVRTHVISIDSGTEFLLSDGEVGKPTTNELAAFNEGGYAFVRSPQPTGPGELIQSGYLAFSAAFHSRAHKHADDLNVVWFDRGQEILVDSGRFGYGNLLAADAPERGDGFYYAAPERQYVEGTMAHNTVMVDGKNHERRARKPYGSALEECTASDGVFDLIGRVHHQHYIHRRRVIYRPGTELVLKDSVFSPLTDSMEGIVWLNISGQFEIETVGRELVFTSDKGDGVTRLHITGPGQLIEPVRGQAHPLRGWRSRSDHSLEPVWSLGFAFPIDTRESVNTRLRLS